MAYKTPNYQKIAGLEDVGMGMEMFAGGIWAAALAAAAVVILAVGIVYVASGLCSVESLTPEQLEQLAPYMTG